MSGTTITTFNNNVGVNKMIIADITDDEMFKM